MIRLLLAAILLALTELAIGQTTDSLITTDTVPDIALKTTTYKLLLKQPATEKYIYSVAGETISYDGSYTVEEKKKHFSVFKFYDKKTMQQYYLLYNYKDKNLYQTEWFEKNAVGDQLITRKVDFKNKKAKVQLGDSADSVEKIKLFEVPSQF